jgi:hypothetical protein
MAEETNGVQTVRVEHAPAKGGEDKGGASVPSFRLREEAERRRAAETKAAELTSQLESLKAQFEKTNAGLRELQTSHGQDMHLIELGFKAPSVRRFFRREYVDSVAEMAQDERPSFNDWLSANATDPLYAVHFERLKAGQPEQEAKPDPETAAPNGGEDLLSAVRAMLESGNPNAGTSQPAAHNGRQYSNDEISIIRGKNRGRLGEHKDAVLATLRAEGLIK